MNFTWLRNLEISDFKIPKTYEILIYMCSEVCPPALTENSFTPHSVIANQLPTNRQPIAKQGIGSKVVERAVEMSDEDMARYATYGGFLVMLLLIIYHYEITPSKAE